MEHGDNEQHSSLRVLLAFLVIICNAFPNDDHVKLKLHKSNGRQHVKDCIMENTCVTLFGIQMNGAFTNIEVH